MASSPRRRSLAVGTVAAGVALACAVGVGALVEWRRSPDRPAPDAELRFDASDADLAAGGATLHHDPTGSELPGDRFELLGGGESGFADYAGRPLVVNFLASWCAPCAEELPGFEEVSGELGDRVTFLGINPEDDAADATRLVAEAGVTFDVGTDPDGSLYEHFGVVSMPSTFLVSADGRIVHAEPGRLEADELRALVADHLLS